MENYGSVSFQLSVSTYRSVTFQLSVKLQMEIYASISEAGEFGHSMFLGKGNQITYLPMPRKYLEAYTTCIVPSYTISIRLYKLIGWTMIYVWSVT